MATTLHTEFNRDSQDVEEVEAVGSGCPLEWWEDAPKRMREPILSANERALRRAAWHARHAPSLVTTAARSWRPILKSSHCLL